MITLHLTQRELACLKDALLVLTLEHAELESARMQATEGLEPQNLATVQQVRTISEVAQKLRDA